MVLDSNVEQPMMDAIDEAKKLATLSAVSVKFM